MDLLFGSSNFFECVLGSHIVSVVNMGFGTLSVDDFKDGFLSYLIAKDTPGFIKTLPIDAGGFIQMSESELHSRADDWNSQYITTMMATIADRGGIELSSKNDLFVLAPSPYFSCIGKIRITHYSNGVIKGPVGESHADSFHTALLQLMLDFKDLNICSGLLDDWMSQDSFLQGFQIADLAAQLNSGSIDYDEFCRKRSLLSLS